MFQLFPLHHMPDVRYSLPMYNYLLYIHISRHVLVGTSLGRPLSYANYFTCLYDPLLSLSVSTLFFFSLTLLFLLV